MNAITCALLSIYCINMATATKSQKEKPTFIKGIFAAMSVIFACTAIILMLCK